MVGIASLARIQDAAEGLAAAFSAWQDARISDEELQTNYQLCAAMLFPDRYPDRYAESLRREISEEGAGK